MTIDEAIKILDVRPGQDSFFLTPKRFEAMGLGIEALHRVKQLRGGLLVNPDSELQGETKE